MWLVIPLAVAIFAMRTVMIGRKLKTAAANPTLADVRAFRETKRTLNAHRARLDEAVAETRGHLVTAKRLWRVPTRRDRIPESRVARMVEDPERAREF